MTQKVSRRKMFSMLADAKDGGSKSSKKPSRKAADGSCGSEITTGINEYTGTFGKAELLHLLKRTLFGVTRDDLDHFSGMSMTQVLDELLQVPTSLSTSPLRDYDSSAPDGEDWAGVAMGETWVNDVLDQSGPGGFEVTYDNFNRDLSLKRWNVGVALDQERSVYEKLVLFWHNHMPTSVELNNRSQRAWLYAKLIRENVNTDLREFLKKMTKDPAMLMYLNLQDNRREAPDENYAREIQELFTIGKQLPADKRYTEGDVQAFARALTGHGTDFSNYLDAVYQFFSFRHATGDKQLSAFYSNAVISGSSGDAAGDDELNQIIDILFDDTDNAIEPLQDTDYADWTRADIIADHIMQKAYRFFVYSEITDDIRQNVIRPMANTFKNNNFKIIPALRQLFSSEHFYDEALRGAYIKMPYDATVGLIRTLGVDTSHDDVVSQYSIYNMIQDETEGMQQGSMEPPNVSGWPAYYQEPQFQKLWINADTLPKRQDFAQRLVGNGIRIFSQSGGNITVQADHIAFVSTLSQPQDPNVVIDEICELLLGVPLSDEHKQQLKTDTLLSGQDSDHYWADAWNAASADNASDSERNTAITRIQNLLDYLVRLEHFQLN